MLYKGITSPYPQITQHSDICQSVQGPVHLRSFTQIYFLEHDAAVTEILWSHPLANSTCPYEVLGPDVERPYFQELFFFFFLYVDFLAIRLCK